MSYSIIDNRPPNGAAGPSQWTPDPLRQRLDLAAWGLRPGTTHHPVFGGVDVGAKCRPVRKGANWNAAMAEFKSFLLSQNWHQPEQEIQNLLAYVIAPGGYVQVNILTSGGASPYFISSYDSIVSYGAMGDPLVSNESGVLLFQFFDAASYNNPAVADNISHLISLTSLDGASTVTIPVTTTTTVPAPPTITTVTTNTVIQSTLSKPINSMIGQTFIIDKSLASGSSTVDILSVDLFMKSKPIANNNSSGIVKPGITVFLVPTVNRVPTFDILSKFPCGRVEYDSITASDDASSSTRVVFNRINVSTGIEYALIIKPDGGAPFEIWKCVQGDVVVGTSSTTAGPAQNYTGLYYELSGDSSDNWKALQDTDIKFKVNGARYKTDSNANYDMSVEKMEYCFFDNVNSNIIFNPGERVFQLQANATGTISGSTSSTTLIGSGTTFSTLYNHGRDPESIVVVSGNTYNLRNVVQVVSNTSIVVDRPLSFTNTAAVYFKSPTAQVASIHRSIRDGGRSMIAFLNNTTSNSSLRFTNTASVIGADTGGSLVNTAFVDINIAGFKGNIDISLPQGTSYAATETFNYRSVSGATQVNPTPRAIPLQLSDTVYFGSDETIVLPSRTNEIAVIGTSPIYSTDASNVAVLSVTPNINNEFAKPTIVNGHTDIYAFRYLINNDYTNENTKYGNAYSKHVTTSIELGSNSAAEDMLVYLTALRPANTDFKVFAKIFNRDDFDAFDDKDWTLMQEQDSVGLYSSGPNDYIELSYGFSLSPNTAFVSNGVSSATFNSAIINGTGTTYNTDFATNDLVKIYPALFPNTYQIGVVSTVANSSQMTLSRPISNNSVTGGGLLIDKLAYKHQAFRNLNNSNVARYYNSSMVEFDTYSTFALKIVFLSDSSFYFPRIKNIRAASVSA